jgi:hypothetical protein
MTIIFFSHVFCGFVENSGVEVHNMDKRISRIVLRKQIYECP